MDWIDQQGTAWIVRMLTKINASPTLRAEYDRHIAGRSEDDFAGYAIWMMHVDRILASHLDGMTSADLADWRSWDSFEAGDSPLEGARTCLEAQDAVGDLLDLLG